MPRIRTPRLLLIPATPASLSAELVSTAALGETLGADVAASWPPELYDADAVRWTLGALESGQWPPDWCLYYIAESAQAASRPRLVGTGGFKGGPDANGTVEIGYGIVTEARRRGYAREAVDGFLGWAFEEPRVSRVVAHTLRELEPSIGVLRSAGFTFVGAGNDPTEAEAIQYELTREDYNRSRESRAPFDVVAS